MADAQNKIVTQIDYDITNGSQTVGAIKQEFKDLNKELSNTVKGSEEYYSILNKLGAAKGEIKDLKDEIKALDPQEQFKAVGGAVKSLIGGFAAATGAIALFGAGNEDLEKSLLKVNASLALLEGFQSLQDGLKKATVLLGAMNATAKVNAAVTNEQAAAQQLAAASTTETTGAIVAETVATETATVATQSFGAALKAIGIGLVIAAIASLVAIVSSYNTKITEAAEATKKLNEETVKFSEIGLKGEQAALERQEELQTAAAKRRAANAVEALQKRGASDAEIAKQAATSEKELAGIQQDFAQRRIDALKRNIAETKNATDGNTVEQLTALKDAEAKKQALIDDNASAESQKAGEAAKAALQKGKEDGDKRIALAQDLAKKLADAEALTSGNNAGSSRDKALADAQAGRDKDLQQLKQYQRDKIISTFQYNQDVATVQQTYNLQLLNIDKVYLKAKTEEEKAAQKKISDDYLKANQDAFQLQQEQLLANLAANDINQRQYDQIALKEKIANDQKLLESDSLTSEARRLITKDLLESQLKQVQEYNALKVEAINNDALTSKTALDDQRQKNLIDENTYQVQLAQIELDKNQRLLDDAIAKGDETVKFESDVTEAKIALAQKEKDARVALLGDIGNALGTLADIAGKQTAAGKALAVAQATIAAIQSAVSSFNSLSSIPIVGPALGAIAAAGALASGYANIKKILAVPVPGANGGSSGSVPGGSAGYTAPTISAASSVTNLSGNSLDAINSRTNTPVRTYVVESDISSTQQRIKGYQEQGSLGGYNNNN